MDPVTIVPTETLQALIGSVEDLKLTVMSTINELKGAKKPYLTINEVAEYTGLSRSAVNANREKIGYTNAGNCVRFKRSDVVEFMEAGYHKKKSGRSS